MCVHYFYLHLSLSSISFFPLNLQNSAIAPDFPLKERDQHVDDMVKCTDEAFECLTLPTAVSSEHKRFKAITVIGGSGSGKTRLVRSFLREYISLHRPHYGRVFYANAKFDNGGSLLAAERVKLGTSARSVVGYRLVSSMLEVPLDVNVLQLANFDEIFDIGNVLRAFENKYAQPLSPDSRIMVAFHLDEVHPLLDEMVTMQLSTKSGLSFVVSACMATCMQQPLHRKNSVFFFPVFSGTFASESIPLAKASQFGIQAIFPLPLTTTGM